MKRLYHFTSLFHWEDGLVSDGVIYPTESNLHRSIEHYGPDVVWLTDVPDPDQKWMRYPKQWLERIEIEAQWLSADVGPLLENSHKGRIRIEVRVPDAKPWVRFAAMYGVNGLKNPAMTYSGSAAKHWWVVPRAVPSDEWVEVTDTRSGTCLWLPTSDASPVGSVTEAGDWR